MNRFNLVFPMFAMVALTALVLVLLFRSRVRAIREKAVQQSYFKVYQGQVEPEYAAKRSRHFSNLFEAPVLFYAVCLAAMVTQQADRALEVLAWIYVAARVAHSFIHLGRNEIVPRLSAYFSSWAALLAMWVYLVVRVATAADLSHLGVAASLASEPRNESEASVVGWRGFAAPCPRRVMALRS